MNHTTISDIDIYYIKKGKGHPLILLHGFLLDSRAYSELIAILSYYYTVYAIDMPFHGKSDSPRKKCSIEDFSELIKGFVTKLNINNPIICGHSAGALIAIDYASKNKVKQLILMEPAGLNPFKSSLAFFLNIIFVKPFVSLFWNPLGTITLNKIGLCNLSRNIFNKYFWSMINENVTKDYSDLIRELRCPVKILWSRNDELINYRYSKVFQHLIKNSKLINVNGSHDWPVLNPKEIMKSKFWRI